MFENDALTLWERGEGILTAANVIGRVTAGFLAVLMGTVFARELTEPASERAAAGSGSVEAAVAERLHPASTGKVQAIFATVDTAGEVNRRRTTNDERQ